MSNLLNAVCRVDLRHTVLVKFVLKDEIEKETSQVDHCSKKCP